MRRMGMQIPQNRSAARDLGPLPHPTEHDGDVVDISATVAGALMLASDKTGLYYSFTSPSRLNSSIQAVPLYQLALRSMGWLNCHGGACQRL